MFWTWGVAVRESTNMRSICLHCNADLELDDVFRTGRCNACGVNQYVTADGIHVRLPQSGLGKPQQ
jgi:hypothetical protein